MSASPIVDAHQQNEVPEGPGSRLRRARLTKGLETSRVAAQLHLSAAMIEALEQDDYRSLPGPVFIRGYLRNYTRLLGMDPQRVLEDFERLVPTDGGASSLAQKSSIKPDVGSSHVLVRIVTWLMVLLLIGLLVIWWQGRLSWPLNTGEPARIGADEPSPVDGAVGALEEAPSSHLASVAEEAQTEEQPGPVDSSQPTESLVSQDAGVDRMPGVPREGTPTLPEPAPVADPESLGQKPEAVESASVFESQPASPGEPLSAVKQASIEFSFSDSSWLDVRDASGKNKFTGVMAQDTRRTLRGEPPFSVVLGNARVVEVRVNDQPYDVSQHIRGNVARFEVDPSSP